MRRPARRFGILVLALALVPGQFSTADAGVIPWLYDSVFGPVGHYGYGGSGYGGYAYRHPYAGPQISYRMPTDLAYYGRSNCGPTGCTTPSYSVGYRPLFSVPSYCSTGGCSTVLSGYRYSSGNCGTCSSVASANSACAAKTAWKSKEPTVVKTEVIRPEAAVPTPTPAAQDDAPRPKTFADEPADPSKDQPTSVEKVVVGGAGESSPDGAAVKVDPNWTKTGKPAVDEPVVTSEDGAAAEAAEGSGAAGVTLEKKTEGAGKESPSAAGFDATLRGAEADVNQEFLELVPGVEPAVQEAAPTKAPVLPVGPEDSLESELTPGKAQPLELDQKSSWKFGVLTQRMAFRAGFRRAKVARASVVVNDDYVVPSAVTLRLVSR